MNAVQCTTFQSIIYYYIHKQYHVRHMSSIESISVSSLMTRDVRTEKEDQNVLTACRIMYENNIGSIIIVKKDDNIKPVGIITERDVVRLLGSLKPDLLQTPLRDIMSRPLVNISINSSVRDAIQTMQQKNIRRLIVSDGEKMVGIITDKDIFRAIMNNQDLIPSLLGDKLLVEHKTVYDQFGQYWFSDILQKP
jgi:CBS domain-containing protein